MDLQGRIAVDIQGHTIGDNIVGNVLGFSGQTLLSYSGPGYSHTQTGWAYEELDGTPAERPDRRHVRDRRRPGRRLVVAADDVTRRSCATATGTGSRGPSAGTGSGGRRAPAPRTTLPDSLYLTQKPAFFGSNPWPWVDPTTGTVYTLPAKARFEAGTPVPPSPQ